MSDAKQAPSPVRQHQRRPGRPKFGPVGPPIVLTSCAACNLAGTADRLLRFAVAGAILDLAERLGPTVWEAEPAEATGP